MRSWRRRASRPVRAVGYRLGLAARQDVITIYLSSEEMFGEAQADRYLAGLRSTFDFLASNPRSARERREFEPPVRIHRYRAHVIVYAVDDEGVLIIRVRHGHEDWVSSPLGDV